MTSRPLRVASAVHGGIDLVPVSGWHSESGIRNGLRRKPPPCIMCSSQPVKRSCTQHQSYQSPQRRRCPRSASASQGSMLRHDRLLWAIPKDFRLYFFKPANIRRACYGLLACLPSASRYLLREISPSYGTLRISHLSSSLHEVSFITGSPPTDIRAGAKSDYDRYWRPVMWTCWPTCHFQLLQLVRGAVLNIAHRRNRFISPLYLSRLSVRRLLALLFAIEDPLL